jgi:molybdopterin converting factor subunit 1
MTLRVLLFASYADAFGAPSVSVDLPAGTRVRDMLAHIQSMAAGKRIPDKPLVAVNKRYASPDQLLAATDEIAIIPPVAGG